jgi:hypothetical protein
MSDSGCTPKFTQYQNRPKNDKSPLTELLDGSFQLLVLTDGGSGDNLLGSSLGTYSIRLDGFCFSNEGIGLKKLTLSTELGAVCETGS